MIVSLRQYVLFYIILYLGFQILFSNTYYSFFFLQEYLSTIDVVHMKK